LLKQLVGRTTNINHSTLRTIAGAQELLNKLCLHGARNDLATTPAIRILAVDDDSVSRFALNLALKKVFDEPDVAENARTALELIQQRRYDLVILDVMMPDIDGFEVCRKIRESVLNESTPVLFVSSMQDFDARTKALSSGGSDLVGKPFLTFEMTVKVLTMILGFRLRDQNAARVTAKDNTVAASTAVLWPEVGTGPGNDDLPTPAFLPPDDEKPAAAESASAPIAMLPPTPFPGGVTPCPTTGQPKRNFNPEFLRYMDAFGPAMKRELTVIGEMKEDAAREEALLRLHLRLQTLSRRINEPELQPAYELTCAVEGLAKRFRADSKKVTRSALRSMTIALDLLKDLCLPGVSPDLHSNPAIQLLVVDDEPLARRALTGALQLTFDRPDGADGAETALVLAQQKEFDVIFLDVSMPPADGFEVCRKLHEIARNHATPVVFVTNHSDDEFRSRADKCGAKDFIVKPFDFVEIPVKALTYALRGRLEKSKAMHPSEPAVTVAGESKSD
jgi:DNA-binding response OmpR family regulator